MNKIGIYLVNGFFSALIGGTIEILSALINKSEIIYLYGLFNSMLEGFITGSVSMFFLINIIMRLTRKMFIGILSNFIVVAGFIGFFYMSSSDTSILHQGFNWLYILAIAETLSCILIAAWFKRMNMYNRLLKKKKEVKKIIIDRKADKI